MKHIFIINPAAGKYDHSQQFRKQIEEACGARGLAYEICVSQKPGDCRDIARKAAESGEEVRLYACGGDGTLNEVVNGVVGFPNAAITHFPGGSGNDAIKIFSETEPFFQLERLLDADEARFDLIRCNDTYSINILSIGFDARVGTDIARFKRLPLVTGKGAYVLSILANMVHGLSEHYVVTLDEAETVDAEQTMICICNGRWYGGGFNPVPCSEPDDGLLDVLLVKSVSRATVANVIGKYKAGHFDQLPKIIRHFTCKRVEITCDRKSEINLDGELLMAREAKFEVVPQAIRFFYPRGLTYHVQGKAE